MRTSFEKIRIIYMIFIVFLPLFSVYASGIIGLMFGDF